MPRRLGRNLRHRQTQIAQSIKAILATADFRAPLRTSLALTRGAGAPTFTRATTGTVVDHEGVLRQVLSGEARFSGARRVRNLLTTTEAITGGNWTSSIGGTGSAATCTPGQADPDGGTTAFRVTATRGAGATSSDWSMWSHVVTSDSATRTYINSIYIKSNTGVSQSVALKLSSITGTDVVVATTSWQRLPIVWSGAGLAIPFAIGVRGTNGDANIDVLIWHPQFEDITGRADQTTPSEYVSVGATDLVGAELVTNGGFGSAASWTLGAGTSIGSGVLSFNGTNNATADQASAMVIGKPYIGTFTVASGSGNVTFYFGSSGGITTSGVTAGNTYTVRGMCAGDTKLYLQSQGTTFTGSLDNVSVKENLFHGTGVDGVKCFDTNLSGNAIPSTTLLGYLAEGSRTNLCLQSQTFDNASWAKMFSGGGSAPVVTADQTTSPDGTTTADKVVFVAPVSGDISVLSSSTIATVTSSIYTGSFYVKAFAAGDVGKILVIRQAGASALTPITLTSSWQRVTLTESAAGTSSTVDIMLRPQFGSSTGTVSVYIWGAQLELGSFASSYIPTTTAAVTRNADVLTYPSAGNVSGTVGSAYAEVNISAPAGITNLILGVVAGAQALLYRKSTGVLADYDGVNEPTGSSISSSAQHKVGVTWGAGAKLCLDGGAAASGSFDGDFNFAGTLYVGRSTSGDELNGNIRNVCIWLRNLPEATLKRISK